MARIITIETSGGISSVALSVDGVCIAIKEAKGNENTHSLTLYIKEVLQGEGLDFMRDIHAVAVSAGPGSYTGLRIGVSTAKGLCFASGKPLIAIGTLDALAQGAIESMGGRVDPNTILCPMIDARRMEIYTARYNYKGERMGEVEAMVVEDNSFADDQKENLLFFGSGAEKCATKLGVDKIEVDLSARWLCGLSEAKFQKAEFEDVAYFEPMYLKEFVALTSTKSLF